MIENPTKIFPCECMGEGIVVTIEHDRDFFDCEGAPFIGLSFWEVHSKFSDDSCLSLWERIKLVYRILKKGSPYLDMVWMRKNNAKKLAGHILNLIGDNNGNPETKN